MEVLEVSDDILDVSTGFVDMSGADDDMLSLRIWDEMFVKGGVKYVFDEMMDDLTIQGGGLVEARYAGALPYLPETVNEELLGYHKYDCPVYVVKIHLKQERKLYYDMIYTIFPKVGLAEFLREISKNPTDLSMIYDYNSWFREYFIRKIAYRYM